jgi:hypothetical protein
VRVVRVVHRYADMLEHAVPLVATSARSRPWRSPSVRS